MGLKRMRFFKYFFTGASDWLREQMYHLTRINRHQARVHGWGVADGLRIQPAAPPSLSVVVPAGLAVDQDGRDVVIEQDQTVSLAPLVPASGQVTAYVAVHYVEAEADPVFVPATGKNENTSVEESGAIEVLSSPPGAGYVEVGRVLLAAGAVSITSPADHANPGPNQVDLRYVRTLSGAAVDQRITEHLTAHRHNGQPGQPPKVKLDNGEEVQGKLPGGMVTGTVPDAETVDGLHASMIAEEGKLLALDSNKQLPASADKVDGFDAAATPQAGKILSLDGDGRFPLIVIPQGHGSGLTADKLDGLEASEFARAGHGHLPATSTRDGFMSAADYNLLHQPDLLLGYDLVGCNLSYSGSGEWPTSATNVAQINDLPKRAGRRQVVTKVSLSLTPRFIRHPPADPVHAYCRLKLPNETWWQSPTLTAQRQAVYDDEGTFLYYIFPTVSAVYAVPGLPSYSPGVPVVLSLYAWQEPDGNAGDVSCTLFYDAYWM